MRPKEAKGKNLLGNPLSKRNPLRRNPWLSRNPVSAGHGLASHHWLCTQQAWRTVFPSVSKGKCSVESVVYQLQLHIESREVPTSKILSWTHSSSNNPARFQRGNVTEKPRIGDWIRSVRNFETISEEREDRSRAFPSLIAASIAEAWLFIDVNKRIFQKNVRYDNEMIKSMKYLRKFKAPSHNTFTQIQCQLNGTLSRQIACLELLVWGHRCAE